MASTKEKAEGQPPTECVYTAAELADNCKAFGTYREIVAVALRFNVPAAAMKLVSALIVAVAISMPAIRAKFAFEQRKHNARKEVH